MLKNIFFLDFDQHGSYLELASLHSYFHLKMNCDLKIHYYLWNVPCSVTIWNIKGGMQVCNQSDWLHTCRMWFLENYDFYTIFYIYKFSHKIDTVIYQFLETGTSFRTPKALRFQPTSLFIFPFNNRILVFFDGGSVLNSNRNDRLFVCL